MAAEMEGNNVFQKFEMSLPFVCTWIDAFERRVRKVEENGGVTLENLRTTLTTPAWKEINDDNSKICKLLTHEVFQKGPGLIDANTLISFALYHCAGSGMDKAKVMYCILQAGGDEVQKFISAQDKDFQPMMDKHIALASLDIVKLMKDIDEVEPMDLAEKEEDIIYSFETIREEVFLDLVYGASSRLEA